MVLVMACAAITVGYFEVKNFLYPSGDIGPVLKESVICRKHKGKLPGMFVTPSDVIFDKHRQRLMVVSRETVFVETEDQVSG